VHISEPKPSTELWFKQILSGLPMDLMLTFLSPPPEFTYSFFNLRVNTLGNEEATHHISGNGLDHSTDKDTSASKRQISFFPTF
jgi:hypothetical protein